MDRSELLEIASQHLDRVLILLTAAGEDSLAQDIEEIAGWLDFPKLPSDAKLMPRIYHFGAERNHSSRSSPCSRPRPMSCKRQKLA
jgi:hypothetical protein